MTTEDVLSLMEAHVNPGLARTFRFLGLSSPEVRAEGVFVYDADGRRYLDFSSGYGVMVHGYRHPRIVAALTDQLARLAMSSRVLPSRESALLAERLAALTPGQLTYCFFCNSGAEAIEAVLKFARIATGRTKIVAMEGAFHGKTMGALSLSGRRLYRAPFAPLLPGVVHIPYGDEAAAEAAIDEETALVLVEPIQGEGGIRVPPAGYLRRLRELTRARGALLGVDEVQTGMGRTGTLWAFMAEEGCEPDLLAAGKALGGGLLPLAVAMGTPEVFAFFDRHPLLHTSTFGGNPLAARVGLAALDVLLSEGLPERARAFGWTVERELLRLAEAYPEVIAEVRGRGLLWGVEVRSAGLGGALMAELLAEGLLMVYTLNNPKVLRLMPPLVIAEEELAMGLQRLEAAVRRVAEVAPLVASAEGEGEEG